MVRWSVAISVVFLCGCTERVPAVLLAASAARAEATCRCVELENGGDAKECVAKTGPGGTRLPKALERYEKQDLLTLQASEEKDAKCYAKVMDRVRLWRLGEMVKRSANQPFDPRIDQP